MKHVRALNNREIRESQTKEIEEALAEIKQKYFSNAMQKKQPNMHVQQILDSLPNDHSSHSARLDSARKREAVLSGRSGYRATHQETLEEQIARGAGPV